MLFLEAAASLCALGTLVSSTESRQATWLPAAGMELRKSHLQLSLLQRPHQLGYGARLDLRAYLLVGGQPDPLVWSGELPDMVLALIIQ